MIQISSHNYLLISSKILDAGFVSPKGTLSDLSSELALSGKSGEGECWDPTSQQPVFFAYLFGPAAYSLCRHEDQEQTSISLNKCMPRSQKLDKMSLL